MIFAPRSDRGSVFGYLTGKIGIIQRRVADMLFCQSNGILEVYAVGIYAVFGLLDYNLPGNSAGIVNAVSAA